MKKPLFHLQYEMEGTGHYTEKGSDNGAKLTAGEGLDPDVWQVLQTVEQMGYKGTLKYLQAQQNDAKGKIQIVPLSNHTPEELSQMLEGTHPQLLFLLRPLHTIEHLNNYLFAINRQMPQGAHIVCHSMTARLQRMLTLQRYPWGIRWIVVAYNYVWHRICPKLGLTRRLYFALTHNKQRTMSRVEIMGRLYRAGFEVVDEQFRGGEFFVTGRKISDPIDDTPPTGGLIIHLRRIGKDGKEIVVHKFRTMYTYSEYVQTYVYHYQSLERGGKFTDDYRLDLLGRIMRRNWIDELPMLWNVLRGDLKLVGVRPLSRQYFNLYRPELQALRIKTKPGMMPPFYYERHTPETLDEVQDSEQRYLEAYLAHPFRTDWKYFWGILGNILFHKKHSA